MAAADKPGRTKPGTKIKANPGLLIALLRRTGMRKGVLGGNRAWAAVAVGTWGFTQLRRIAARNAVVVLSEELKPGQRIIISNNRPTVDSAPGD